MVLFFFFYKQKTAYEMRISDWSSDVCSSDLSTEPVRSARSIHQMGDRQQFSIGAQGERGRVNRVPDAINIKVSGLLEVYLRVANAGFEQGQIGRASWRERVCQYV